MSDLTAHERISIRRLLAGMRKAAKLPAPPQHALPYDEAAELALPGRHRAPRHAHPEPRDNRLFPLAA